MDWLKCINWEELERQTGWGLTVGDGAFDERFDEPGQVERAMTAEFSRRFDERLVASFNLSPDDTVVDLGCGVGRLTVPMARHCKQATGLDGSENRLRAVRALALERGCANVDTIHANWHEVEPGLDIPQFDVAVGCNSPATVDIAKFSRAATKRCLFVHCFSGAIPSMVEASLFRGVDDGGKRAAGRAWATDDYRGTPKSAFYVTFNHLLSLGAAPTVRYCDAGWHVEAADLDALCERLRRGRFVPREKAPVFKENVSRYAHAVEGGVAFERTHKVVVMEWDPQTVSGWR